MGRLPLGKVDPDLLKRHVFGRLPALGHGVVVGPSVGEDAAVIELPGEPGTYMVVSSDPISGAEADMGRYAVHVNANDVATSGARPAIFFCNVLLRRSAQPSDLDTIFSGVTRECSSLGVTVAGGHTEVAPIERTVISSTMIGFVERGRLARRPVEVGDGIVLTKGAGVEGTSIISNERARDLEGRLGRSIVSRARAFSSSLSVVPEAMIAAEVGVSRMHDPTEGGIIGGLMEMCVATDMSARINIDRIPVAQETRSICHALGIDPLRLIGSGALLCVLSDRLVEHLLAKLSSSGIPAAKIGVVQGLGAAELRLDSGSGTEIVQDFPADELWKVVG